MIKFPEHSMCKNLELRQICKNRGIFFLVFVYVLQLWVVEEMPRDCDELIVPLELHYLSLGRRICVFRGVFAVRTNARDLRLFWGENELNALKWYGKERIYGG